MNRLIALAFAGVLVSSMSVGTVHAQVGIDVRGNSNGSVGGNGSSANVDADIEASVGADASDDSDSSVSSDDQDSSGSGVSFSISQSAASSASLDAEGAELSASSVSSNDDLSVFATSHMKRDTNIENVEVSNEGVSVEYNKEARFLGFISGHLSATAKVSNDGSVDIDYPWYRFLFKVAGSDDVEAQLERRVQELMAGASAELSAQLKAQLIEAIHLAFQGPVPTSTEAATTADRAGTGGDTTVSGSTTSETSGDTYDSSDASPN